MKHKHPPKRKDAPTQIYRPVARTLLLTDGGMGATDGEADTLKEGSTSASNDGEGSEFDRAPKKKKPTPDNSAETAVRSCPSQ